MALSVATPVLAGAHKAVPKSVLEAHLKTFVLSTKAKNVTFAVQPYVESYSVDDARRVFTINISQAFATQYFTDKSVNYYYKHLAKALPKPYNRYTLHINTVGMPIEQLVPGAKDRNAAAGWGRLD